MAPLPSSVAPIPPQHTRRYSQLALSDLDMAATAVFAADSTEPRGHLQVWKDLLAARPSQCVVIMEQEAFRIRVARADGSEWVSLRDEAKLAALMTSMGNGVYLDISGLGHHVWAPLFRAGLARPGLRAVYAEPMSYRHHPSPASPTMFDLSVDIGGVAPLPGMTRFREHAPGTKSLLVCFMGFEGNRAQHVALRQQDDVSRVIPVVGVPGFRLEYPAFAISCNRAFLEENGAHAEIRLARASCPFEAYAVLSDLRRDYRDYYFYIAPLGTKPHALGAIHYAIKHPEVTEVIYDHPVRKPGRTSGVGSVHVYEMT